jgi:hypothetical protein
MADIYSAGVGSAQVLSIGSLIGQLSNQARQLMPRESIVAPQPAGMQKLFVHEAPQGLQCQVDIPIFIQAQVPARLNGRHDFGHGLS